VLGQRDRAAAQSVNHAVTRNFMVCI